MRASVPSVVRGGGVHGFAGARTGRCEVFGQAAAEEVVAENCVGRTERICRCSCMSVGYGGQEERVGEE